jgi:Uma2 family endonuclease
MSAGTRPPSIVRRDDVPVDRFYRLSVDQYRRMADAGILAPEDRVELSEGILLSKNPSSSEPSGPYYRLSVEQYHEMARAGILTTEDRVELLGGWLVVKMTKNPPHTIATGLLHDELIRIVPVGWFVANQDPLSATDSEPEPDLMIVRGRRRDYPDGPPGPRDVALVVEVADSTLAEDRLTKKRTYAAAGIATYWIVNLIARQVEVHTAPTVEVPGYAHRETYGADAEVPVILDDREVGRIVVREILP